MRSGGAGGPWTGSEIWPDDDDTDSVGSSGGSSGNAASSPLCHLRIRPPPANDTKRDRTRSQARRPGASSVREAGASCAVRRGSATRLLSLARHVDLDLDRLAGLDRELLVLRHAGTVVEELRDVPTGREGELVRRLLGLQADGDPRPGRRRIHDEPAELG